MVSLSWIFNEEEFFKNLFTLPSFTLKLGGPDLGSCRMGNYERICEEIGISIPLAEA
jgi:hypothetical protein